MLWVRASCTRPTNKGGTLRGGFFQERMGLVLGWFDFGHGELQGDYRREDKLSFSNGL